MANEFHIHAITSDERIQAQSIARDIISAVHAAGDIKIDDPNVVALIVLATAVRNYEARLVMNGHVSADMVN